MLDSPPRFFDFHSVTVMTTDKCTAKCAHCCVSSTPRRKATLNFEQIKERLDTLFATHPIKVVIFAGGEPSLLKNDLVKAIQYCTDHGKLSRVVTNASWAIDEKRTDAMLSKWRAAGLDDLNISADDYHLPYIPLDRLKRIWDMSKGRGFNAVIVALAYQKGSYVDLERLQTLFEDPNIPQVYDENGNANDFEHLRHADGTMYAICRRPSSRAGRGVKMLDTEDMVFLDNKNEYSTCPWIRSAPAISPKGELVACCGFEVRKVKELNYGQLDSTRIDSLEAFGDDVVLHAITQIGPKRLLEFVREKEGADINFDRHVSMCEACEDLMGKPANIAILRKHASELAAWIISKRKQM